MPFTTDSAHEGDILEGYIHLLRLADMPVKSTNEHNLSIFHGIHGY
jgi:hypothetical protein